MTRRRDEIKALFARLEEWLDAAPLDSDEAREILAGVGGDSTAAFERFKKRREAFEAEIRSKKFVALEEERRAQLKKLERRVQHSKLPVERLRAMIEAVSARIAPELLSASYRDLKSAPAEDLASLLADLEELAGSDDEPA